MFVVPWTYDLLEGQKFDIGIGVDHTEASPLNIERCMMRNSYCLASRMFHVDSLR
jgi:hypothetical protein